MNDKEFDRPVRINTGPNGSVIRTVSTTKQAADYLLNKWPNDKTGLKHLQARLACMAVLEGLKEARAARKAFEAAAKEAEMLVTKP